MSFVALVMSLGVVHFCRAGMRALLLRRRRRRLIGRAADRSRLAQCDRRKQHCCGQSHDGFFHFFTLGEKLECLQITLNAFPEEISSGHRKQVNEVGAAIHKETE